MHTDTYRYRIQQAQSATLRLLDLVHPLSLPLHFFLYPLPSPPPIHHLTSLPLSNFTFIPDIENAGDYSPEMNTQTYQKVTVAQLPSLPSNLHTITPPLSTS
jgi:hypothetical protein